MDIVAKVAVSAKLALCCPRLFGRIVESLVSGVSPPASSPTVIPRTLIMNPNLVMSHQVGVSAGDFKVADQR